MSAIDRALNDLHETREIIDSLSRDLYESIDGMQADYEHRKKTRRQEKTDDVTLFTKKFDAYTQKMGVSMAEVRDKRIGREGDTLLHSAARVGIMPIVAFLLEQGADVNAIDSSHTLLTPILKALSHGHFEVAYLLAHNGANLKCRDAHGRNILHYIAKRNSASAARHIIKQGDLHEAEVMELANQRHTYEVNYKVEVRTDTDIASAKGKMMASALAMGKNPAPGKIEAGTHDVQMHREKRLPEDVAPPDSLVRTVLISFRTSGRYHTHGQKKVIESQKRMTNSGKRRGNNPQSPQDPEMEFEDEMDAREGSQVTFSDGMGIENTASQEGMYSSFETEDV